MEFRTFTDLSEIINRKIDLIPNDVDLIVGVPRSGMLPATIISLLKNKPLVDFDSFKDKRIYIPGETKKNQNWISSVEEAKKILIVEDSSCSGNSIKKVKNEVLNLFLKSKVIYVAIYCTKESKKNVDIYFELIEDPRVFEWNYLHHGLLGNTCFDIDGVLCDDPTEQQNDDGEEYKQFILNATPRIIPTKTIGYLVTSRLEKYRDLTDDWLSRNDIKYGKMFMMQYKTKEERLLHDNHGEFKAEIYKSLKDTVLFVESDPYQAEIINQLSKKAVFCTGNQFFYSPDGLNNIRNKFKYNNNYKIYSIFRKTFLFKLLQSIKHKIFK